MEQMIADSAIENVGYYDGVFGGYSSLGVDMYGDLNLDDDLPVAKPRPQPQNNAKNFVATIPKEVVRRAVVVRGTEKPKYPGMVGNISNKDLLIGGAMLVALLYLTRK